MEIDGEITLFHTGTQAALVLNETASDVWRLLDGKRTAEVIVQRLRLIYEVDDATLEEGVERALAEFDRHGLVESSRP